MSPTNDLDGEDEGEEDKATSEVGEGALLRPSAGGSCEDILVNNMMRLNIERGEVKEDNEEEEDDECLLQTLTIQVSSE